jgi:peroxiredoxin family protein
MRMTEPGALVVLLHRSGWPDRYQAVTLAATAAALGERVTVALFFDALRAWVEGRFDEGAPPEAAGARIASLADTLQEARRELGVEVVACETAVRLAGLEPGALGGAVDRIVTLPALWKLARDGRQISI